MAFDIDANGILAVSVRDKETSKEQQISITGSTQLSKDDIDRMVADAQAHGAEDKQRRQEIEVRNAARTRSPIRLSARSGRGPTACL